MAGLITLGSARLQAMRDETTVMSTWRDSHSGRKVAKKVAICATQTHAVSQKSHLLEYICGAVETLVHIAHP
jgi:hypothetical protein